MTTILVVLFIGMAIVIIAMCGYVAYRVSLISGASRKHGFLYLWIALNMPPWAHPYWREKRDEEPEVREQMERLRVVWRRQALLLALLIVLLAAAPFFVLPARP